MLIVEFSKLPGAQGRKFPCSRSNFPCAPLCTGGFIANNAASLKEARVDHNEGGVCVTSIQGGVERRNNNISASV